VIPAKVWRPRGGDPLNPNGWDCADCASIFRAKWGCLCEILAPGMKSILYVRTEVPDNHINDVRAMYHEDTLKPRSAQSLYDKVPEAYPSLIGIVKEVDGKPGIGKVESVEIWNNIPMFNWFQIFNLFGVEMPEAPPSKRGAKKARQAEKKQRWDEQAAKSAASGSSP